MWKSAILGVLVLGGVASADPTARFGLTFGVDHVAPGPELGPAVAIGERLGPLVGELEYAYLSFFEPDSYIHRLGITLRGDLARSQRQCKHYGCTRATSVYAEAGAAERFGQWIVDAQHVAPASSPQPEIHFGLGYELDNQVAPYRNGWQLGVRVALSRNDAALGTACRGSTCMATAPSGSGVGASLLVEWMFLLGR